MNTDYDVIIVGAGPAGAVAACDLAQRGRSVLLLDKAAFPRHKVCGGCLSPASLQTLRALGLDQMPRQLGGVPTDRFELHAGCQRITLPLDPGVAVSRSAFDHALVQAAVARGATFLDRTAAECDGATDDRRHIRAAGQRFSARVVLAADGLAGSFLRDPEHRPRVAARAYMGVSAVIPAPRDESGRGAIRMHCAPGGYVGVTHVENGSLNVAAALAPRFVRDAGGPGAAVDAIIHRAGGQLDAIPNDQWRGVGRLTRRRRCLADHRLFILGDAAGYVEPFTGEGMAWAMTAAVAASEIANAAVDDWHHDMIHRWAHAYRRLVADRQRCCRLLTTILRFPTLTTLAIRLLQFRPSLARPVLEHLSHSTDPQGKIA